MDEQFSSASLNTEKSVQPPAPPEPAKPPAPTPPPVIPRPIERLTLRDVKMEEKPSILNPLRTLKGDIESGVQSGNVTVTKIVTAEAKRREEPPVPRIEQKSPTLIVLLVALGITALLGGGVLVYLAMKPPGNPVSTEKLPNIVETDTAIQVPFDGTDGRRNAARIAYVRNNQTSTLGAIIGMHITPSAATTTGLSTAEFLSSVGANAPELLERSLLPRFGIGIHVFDANQLYLLLETDSYEQGFAGMLEWEPHLIDDIGSLFRPLRDFALGTEDIVTAAPTFEDAVIRNKDVRVIKDKTGKVLFLWGFADRQTLIISGSAQTFGEILLRLARTKVSS